MTKENQPKRRAAAYMRDMSQDGEDQQNLVGTERLPELEKLLEEAARNTRPFDVVVVVATRAVVEDLRRLGVEVQDTDDSLTGEL